MKLILLIENTINEYLKPSYQLQMENYDESKEIHNIPVDVMWEYREFNRCDDDNIKGDNYIEKLTNDIKENGVKSPIILQIDDENKGLIIEGNHRLCISIKLGLKTIPVKIIYGIFYGSEKHKAKPIRNNFPKGYLIKSNKPNEGERKEKDYGFRTGDIEGSKPKDMQRMDSRRSTGHFGTGYYFFGDEDSAKNYQKVSGGRDIRIIDFSKYNLFKITTKEFGLRLHEFFKKLNNGDFLSRFDAQKFITLELISDFFEGFNKYDSFYLKFPNFNYIYNYHSDLQNILKYGEEYFYNYIYDFNKNKLIKDLTENGWDSEEDLILIKNIIIYLDNYVKPVIKRNLLETFNKKVLPFLEILNNENPLDEYQEKDIIKLIFSDLRIKSNNYRENLMIGKDTLSTRIMKYFGYEGIDVRGVNGLDNSEYGSVIYDIKQNSIINEQKNKIKLYKIYKKIIKENNNDIKIDNNEDIIFIRTKKFNNIGTVNKLPYNGIQCWAIYENDLEKYIKELELWGGDKRDIEIINSNGYEIFALDYTKVHKYVMGESDIIPKLETFNKEKHILNFIKQGEKSMLEYVADMKYQIILL